MCGQGFNPAAQPVPQLRVVPADLNVIDYDRLKLSTRDETSVDADRLTGHEITFRAH